jgi:hypothetical protein
MLLFKQSFSITHHLSGIGLNIYAIGQQKTCNMLLFGAVHASVGQKVTLLTSS